MALIRSAALRGFRATVAELGGDAEYLAVAAGLPVAALDSDDLMVDDVALATLLELGAERLQCPDLGLSVASRQDLGMLGPLALAIQNSPTMGDALECTSRYLFMHARSLRLYAEPDLYGERGIVALHLGPPAGAPTPVQGTDLGLGFLHRSILSLNGGPYGLRSVELPYRPKAPASTYERFFGVRAGFAQPSAALRVPVALMRQPLTGTDESLRRLALAFLATQAPDRRITPRVHAAVAQALGTYGPDLHGVSRLLAMHPRTLQRRLAAEGTTFGAILDDVRRRAALRYLTTTEMPMPQVAGMVGLSEQSALTRCCRRWFGATPTAVRRAADGG